MKAGGMLMWTGVGPDEWTMVPLLVKVYKLVINELSNQIEKSTSTRATTGDEDEVCKLTARVTRILVLDSRHRESTISSGLRKAEGDFPGFC